MEDADRRATGNTRVSLDGVIVRLDQGDASFEADGKDLGPGGLALRAACLPEVGARLRCRFARSQGEGTLEAQAEVVWAEEAGGTGQFGIRFVALDPAARAAIRRIADPTAAPYVPPPPQARKSVGTAAFEVAVRFDGAEEPVRGTVLHDDGEGMILEQPLPLLRLHAGVLIERDGRRGRIGAIDLIVEGGTPRLVLDIAFEAPEEAALQTLDEQVTWERAAPEPALDVSNLVGEPDGVEPWDDTLAEPVIVTPPASECVVPADCDTDLPSAMEAQTVACTERDDRHLVSRRERWLRTMREARTKLAVLRASMGTLGAGLWASAREWAGPAVHRLWLHARAGLAKMGPLVLPMARKLPAVGLRRTRRRTSPAPGRTNLRRGLPSATRKKAVSVRSRRRTVLLSVLAFSAVAALVAAFAPGGDPPAAPVEVATPAPPVAPADLGPAPPVANAAPVDVALPSAATPPDPPAPATAGHAPAAQLPAGAARELGPMAAPTFPTMGGDAPTVAAPTDNAVPVSPSPTPAAPSPTPATPQVVEGTSFGAASVRGRSFLIRMSQPVSLLRGVDEGNGFRVVIPDSLSLDRASPIAAAHPLVERAMILNLGDHAELIVTFVEGRVPAYRVVARGRAVELVIGRRPAGRSS